MSCLCGSKKKSDAPDVFVLGSGAICFLIGLDSPLCSLLDKIPGVVGKSWEDILKTVAKKVFNIVINEITGAIDTSSFCLVQPKLPAEITYGDVFNWLASYVPEIGLLANPDSLLAKITQYYLYQKYFDYCECVQCSPSAGTPTHPSPQAYIPSCEAAAAYAQQIGILGQSTSNGGAVVSDYWFFNVEFSGTIIKFADFDSLIEALNQNYINSNSQYALIPAPQYDANSITRTLPSYYQGCIKVTTINYSDTVNGSAIVQKMIINDEGAVISIGNSGVIQHVVSYAPAISYDDSLCCVPPTISLPTLDDVILPPPPYLERYPDEAGTDPNCTNEEFIDVPVFVDCGDRGSIRLALNVSGTDETISVRDTVLCDHPQSDMVLTTCSPLVLGCSYYQQQVADFAVNLAATGTIYDGTNRPYRQSDLGSALTNIYQLPFYQANSNCYNEFRQYFTDAWNNYFNPVVTGCTDPSAINYNPLATVDDGSCIFDDFDCTTLQDQFNTWGTNDATYYKSIGADMPSELQSMLDGLAMGSDYTDHPKCSSQFNQWYTDAWNAVADSP